ARSSGERAASAILMPSPAKTRATAALSPDPAPTIRAVLNFIVVIARASEPCRRHCRGATPGTEYPQPGSGSERMRAAYYEKNGAARDVLHVGDVETPRPGPGEVRVKLKASGVNPSDVKAREGRTRKIAYPRVIPHSDGAGEIDTVGSGVPASRQGERVWVWNAQWKRPFGTCAEYVTLPTALAVPLPANTSFEAGACLGIPAMT